MNLPQNKKKFGLFLLVLMVILAFYIFSSRSITTINDEEEKTEEEQQDFHNDPYEIFYTHTLFEKNHESWSISGEGFNYKRFTESDYTDFQKGKLFLRYKGDKLPLEDVSVSIESVGGKTTLNTDLLKDRELVFNDLDQLGHYRSASPVTVTIQWNGKEEVIELDGEIRTFHEHYLNHPISVNAVKVPTIQQLKRPVKENDVMIEDDDFIATVPLTHLMSAYLKEDTNSDSDGNTKDIPFIMDLPANDMTTEFSFQVNHVDDGDEISFLYQNEFGNVIEANHLTLSSEGLENGMMKTNISISFEHFGRKRIWAEVNGEKVGEFGISLRPKARE